jgi:hypothetical protein
VSTEHLWLDTWRAREPARRSAEGGDRETCLRHERLLLLLLLLRHDLDQILNLLKELNPVRSELLKLLLLKVFELHELLQRLQELLLRCMYAVQASGPLCPHAQRLRWSESRYSEP